MASEDLPAALRSFIESYIDSVEQLLVLLLLHANSTRSWSIPEITLELRSTDASIKKRVESLYLKKVLLSPGPEGLHQFISYDNEIRKLVDELADQNKVRPYQIIEAIYSRKEDSITALANAFKVRGDKK